MTINSINHGLGGYEAQRLDKQDKLRQENQRPVQQQDNASDRISISDEGRLKANMLKAAQEHDGVRPDVVADAKARIESGQYKPNGKDIAAKMLQQELDVWG